MNGSDGQKQASSRIGVFLLGALLLAGLALWQFRQGGGDSSAQPEGSSTARAVPADTVQVLFVYGSEKQAWIEEATKRFNQLGLKLSGGKKVQVRQVPLGSGESVEEVLAGRLKAALLSPASSAFVELGNAQSVAATGKPLLGATRNLVLSPVVIAMWRPMAQALGWPQKRLGWADILKLAQNPQGWQALGHPEWGRFKFGHTNPRYSNSGLISLLAEAYAAVGKTRNLTRQDLQAETTASFLRSIERSVVHYGSSTGFFGQKMLENGPGYLSAAVLYENMVIDSYARQPQPEPPLVAIYPAEGTFWSDHPCAVVERDWVGPEEREGALLYQDFLLKKEQQERALAFGFRPGDAAVQIGAPVDAAHGADPAEPRTTLAVPGADRIGEVLALWDKNKKRSNVVLVFDRSGSMRNDRKIESAKEGVQAMLQLLGDEDSVSLLVFNNQLTWVAKDVAMKNGGREQVMQAVGGLFPDGGTALYDATSAACAHLREQPRPEVIQAVVVLTDGDDTNSKTTFERTCQAVAAGAEEVPVRVFSIGYGADAKLDKLNAISNATQAKAFAGDSANIREIFKNISTFF